MTVITRPQKLILIFGFLLTKSKTEETKKTNYYSSYEYNCRYHYSRRSSFFKGCKECDPGYYQFLASYNYFTCASCSPGCLSCFNSFICQQCKNEYFLGNDNLCYSCPNGCDVCRDDDRCQSCSSEYFLTDDGGCESCSSNCVKCRNGDKCDSCKEAFYLDSQNRCKNCPLWCSECDGPSRCSECEFGYKIGRDGLCREKTFFEKLFTWFLIIGTLVAIVGACCWCCKKCQESKDGSDYQREEREDFNAGYEMRPVGGGGNGRVGGYQGPVLPAPVPSVPIGPGNMQVPLYNGQGNLGQNFMGGTGYYDNTGAVRVDYPVG